MIACKRFICFGAYLTLRESSRTLRDLAEFGRNNPFALLEMIVLAYQNCELGSFVFRNRKIEVNLTSRLRQPPIQKGLHIGWRFCFSATRKMRSSKKSLPQSSKQIQKKF